MTRQPIRLVDPRPLVPFEKALVIVACCILIRLHGHIFWNEFKDSFFGVTFFCKIVGPLKASIVQVKFVPDFET